MSNWNWGSSSSSSSSSQSTSNNNNNNANRLNNTNSWTGSYSFSNGNGNNNNSGGSGSGSGNNNNNRSSSSSSSSSYLSSSTPSTVSSSSLSNSNRNNPNESKVCPMAPMKAISSLRFNPRHDIFTVGSWDNQVCCYAYSNTGEMKSLAKQTHANPILGVCWSTNGQTIFSAGCDCTVRAWNPQQNHFTIIGKHKAPVRCVEVVAPSEGKAIVSGSWDNTITFWDVNSSNSNGNKGMQSINVGAKVYCMASRGNILAVGLANRKVHCYDLRKLGQTLQTQESNLKAQLRCLDVFPKGDGYAVASVEGRASVEYFQHRKNDNFAFKCHRQDTSKDTANVYAVNALRCHPSGVMATGGADGSISLWDIESKSRLKSFQCMPLPIVALDFDRTAQKLGYAISYDWSQGIDKWNEQLQKPQIFLHALKKEDIMPEKS